MTTLDFSKCKSKEDVEKVFDSSHIKEQQELLEKLYKKYKSEREEVKK